MFVETPVRYTFKTPTTLLKLRLFILFSLLYATYAVAAPHDDNTRFVPADQPLQYSTPEYQQPSLSHRDSVRLFRKPDALRSVWMGAIIPGYGQINNRSYWKLPVVYGAFFGCAYAITWTNGIYNDYKTAYRDIATAEVVTEDPSNSYIAILPDGYTLSRVGGAAKWEQTLQSRQNSYRRYRDISIVATVLVYALSLIDAYVDAQLFDFDITPDLTMDMQPELRYDILNNPSAEMRFAVRF